MSELVLTVRGPDGTVQVARYPQAEVEVGRSAHTQLTLDHPSVSTVHARFLRRGADYVVIDERSAGGTWVEEQRIHAPTPVGTRSRVRVGPYQIDVAIDDAQGFTTDLATADRLLKSATPAKPPPQRPPWSASEAIGAALALGALVTGFVLLLT